MASITHSTPSQPQQTPVVAGAPHTSLPALIQSDLRELFANSPADSRTLEAILALTAKHTQSNYVAYFQADQQRLTPIAIEGRLNPPENTFNSGDIEAICLESLNHKELRTRCVSPEDRLFVIAVPMAANEHTPTVLAAVVTPTSTGIGPQLATVERMAAAIVQWRLTNALTRLDWEAHTCAAAAELTSRIETSENIVAAEFCLVNELKDFLECNQVALSSLRTAGVGCRIRAISGMAEFDRSSETVEHLTSAMNECFVRHAPTCWPPLNAADRHATLAHRKLTQQSREEAAYSVPLTTVDGEDLGVLTLTGPSQVIHHERVQSAAVAMAPHLATALRIRRQAEPSWWDNTLASIRGTKGSSRHSWMLIATILACCLIPIVPWRFRVKSECLVEPVVRRYLVAPFQGHLEQCFVKPGDEVRPDQALAKMDVKSVRWELEQSQAELGQAMTEKDLAMNEHKNSSAKLAQLEIDRVKSRIEMLQSRQDQLEIRSPLAGVVLKGDLDDAEGAPVDEGQMLFEIAPLDSVKLELAIAEVDIQSVKVGMPVTAQLEGYRGPEIKGTVDKIHPRSEIRDSANVFIVEVELPNREHLLRPGMGGTARVAAGTKPLGWIWFHKAWHKARIFLGT